MLLSAGNADVVEVEKLLEGKLGCVAGSCGNNMGGAATVEPMLVQLPPED